MEGLDASAFTGGSGENANGVRARVIRGLEWTGARLNPDANHTRKMRLHADSSKIAIWIVPAREEEKIARDARSLMETA